MKIVFCLGSMTQGGAERVVANLCNYLIDKNDVSVIVTNTDKAFYKLDEKINYYTLDIDDKKENVLFRTIKRISRLRSILKSEKPDVVLSFLPEPTFRVLIAKKFLNMKTIVSVRNDPKILYNSFFKKLIVKILYPSADGFVFQTEEAQKWFSKKIQNKSVVIPNPINESFIGKPYTGKREKTIVNVARFVKQKRQRLIIDAFKEVLLEHNDYVLKFYGDGPLKAELEEYVKSINLDDKILFMGECNNIKEEIYKAGMFVLASDYEGMPNALMEAMALGIPCISTDCPCGGPRFLIKNKESGILVKVNDKQELIESMLYYINNNDLAKKMGDNANKICDDLNPNKINNMWESYIKKLVTEYRF